MYVIDPYFNPPTALPFFFFFFKMAVTRLFPAPPPYRNKVHNPEWDVNASYWMELLEVSYGKSRDSSGSPTSPSHTQVFSFLLGTEARRLVTLRMAETSEVAKQKAPGSRPSVSLWAIVLFLSSFTSGLLAPEKLSPLCLCEFVEAKSNSDWESDNV